MNAPHAGRLIIRRKWAGIRPRIRGQLGSDFGQNTEIAHRRSLRIRRGTRLPRAEAAGFRYTAATDRELTGLLAEAEAAIAECEQHIAQQRAVIEKLSKDGLDTAEAKLPPCGLPWESGTT